MRLTHRINAAIITLVLAIGLSGSQANARLISEKQELSMGRDAARQVESQFPVSNDPRMTEIVRNIGKRVAAVSERPNITWTFKVLDTKDVNALSVPGYVYVNKGLIDFVNGDRDKLAAVIAHEVGHTTGHHAVKQAEKQIYGSAIIGLIFKKSTQTASIFANLALLGYSRKDEFDADQRGVRYSYAAGYDPNGMVRFFKQLQAKQGSESKGLATYFKTHPPTSDRIARVQSQIAQLR